MSAPRPTDRAARALRALRTGTRAALVWALVAIQSAPAAAEIPVAGAPIGQASIGQASIGRTPVAARTIRAQSVLAPADLLWAPGEVAGAILDPALLVGQEARVALYAGRPIMPGEIGPPALVERNQVVRLVYAAGGLSIIAEGRALARGGAGEALRVMNLASRATVTGVVRPDGAVEVAARPGA